MTSRALAGWWGYAEGDTTIVGAIVVLVVICALVYIGMRLAGKH